MSVDEFARLEEAAGETKPNVLQQRRAVVQRGLPLDPLGRDTSDFDTFLTEVTEHAISGKDRDAIDNEIRSAERRLGLERGAGHVRS